ncbi:MAG: CopG family transcriptional regulator [Opitutaceae bacterium]|nr:CopG family transcriptional regulator [Opitutaceae bacterium]
MTTSIVKTKPAAPLTFELTVDLMDKIEACRKIMGVATASEVIRTAIARFDFSKCKPVQVPHRQISVRLSTEHRATLKRQARLKDVSVGELLRLAIEGLQAKSPKPAKKAASKRKK